MGVVDVLLLFCRPGERSERGTGRARQTTKVGQAAVRGVSGEGLARVDVAGIIHTKVADNWRTT